MASCDQGTVGGGSFVCSPPGWIGHSTECSTVTCGRPVAPAHGRYDCNNIDNGGTCTLVCDSQGYIPVNFQGTSDVTLHCSVNGTWIGPAGACVPLECPKIHLGHGLEVFLRLFVNIVSNGKD